jgi:mono/diheme cytochrome c family protein
MGTKIKMIKFVKILLALAFASIAIFSSCSERIEKPSNEERKVSELEKPNASVTEAHSASRHLDELADARKLFSEKCARCHKEDGSGGKVVIDGEELRVPNFASEKMKKEPDKEFIEVIKNGIPDEGMPSFKKELTEEQIKDLVNFIRKEFQKQ